MQKFYSLFATGKSVVLKNCACLLLAVFAIFCLCACSGKSIDVRAKGDMRVSIGTGQK